MCIFLFVRATMPFILLFYIFDTIISCIYTDILHCPLKLLHHLNIRIYFWLSMPAILLSTCMFHFALMATFTDMFVHYLCTYIAILSTLLVL